MAQYNALRVLKKYCTLFKCICSLFTSDQNSSSPRSNASYTLVSFVDATNNKNCTHICHIIWIIGLVTSPVCTGSPLHILSWSSRLSSRRAQSTFATGILDATKGIEKLSCSKRSTVIYLELIILLASLWNPRSHICFIIQAK